jgi:hypothetical protein
MSIGQALKDGALFWIDHHGFVRAIEEIFATWSISWDSGIMEHAGWMIKRKDL